MQQSTSVSPQTPEKENRNFLTRHLEKHYGSPLFTHQKIFSMLLPLILDSFFVMAINMLTTAMISSSSQESVSAVSLIGPINMMLYAVYNAISAGGTVIVAQYKGAGNEEKMKQAAGQLLVATPLSAVIGCLILTTFSGPIVEFLFKGVDAGVMQKAEEYLIGVSVSSIFLAVYMGGFSVFRGLGETKRCLRLTIVINLLHFLCSLLFINLWHLDIMGSVLALNIARFVGGAAAVFMLLSPRSVLRVKARHIFRLDRRILRDVFRIGIPFGMEQLFMNGGTMLVQIYVAGLGTACVAANAIGNSVFAFIQAAPMAASTLAVTVIGQCYGAGDRELAKRYGKSMVRLTLGLVILSIALCLPFLPQILKLYKAPAETVDLIYSVLTIALVSMPLAWPISYIMPSVMRATGDAKFSSYFALVTMWVVRVGLGYVFTIPLGLGIQGIWVSMVLEWVIRSIVFWIRYRSGVWLDAGKPGEEENT